MIRYLLGAAVVATLATPAFAQWVPSIPGPPALPGYTPPRAPVYQPPQTSSTFDVWSGNSTTTTRRQDGSSNTQGFNVQTGSMWNSQTDANGNSRGMDSRGNTWSYNPSTGLYTNTDGTICTGTGYARTCTK